MPHIEDRGAERYRRIASGFDEASNQIAQIDAGTLPGYAATSPTARGYAQQLAAAGQYKRPPQVQMPQGIAPNQMNPATGMTPQQEIANHSLDVRDGFALKPKPVAPVAGLRNDAQREQARSAAIAQIQQRKAARQGQNQLAPGLGVGAPPVPDRQQEAIAEQQETMRQAAIAARQPAPKEPEAPKPPSISDLQRVMPLPDDATDAELQEWAKEARRRWDMLHTFINPPQGTPAQPPQYAPPSTAKPAQLDAGLAAAQTQPQDSPQYQPRTPEEWKAIPKGATYLHPDGTVRKKK